MNKIIKYSINELDAILAPKPKNFQLMADKPHQRVQILQGSWLQLVALTERSLQHLQQTASQGGHD